MNIDANPELGYADLHSEYGPGKHPVGVPQDLDGNAVTGIASPAPKAPLAGEAGPVADEPTLDMLEAGWAAFRDSDKPAPFNQLADAFRAMLAARHRVPTAAKLQIKAGAYYLKRNGDKVGPMFRIDGDSSRVWYQKGGKGDWFDDGEAAHALLNHDLVSEWSENTAHPTPAPSREDGGKLREALALVEGATRYLSGEIDRDFAFWSQTDERYRVPYKAWKQLRDALAIAALTEGAAS